MKKKCILKYQVVQVRNRKPQRLNSIFTLVEFLINALLIFDETPMEIMQIMSST